MGLYWGRQVRIFKLESLWDMDFNPSKCQVLHISKSRHPAQHIYIYIYMLHGQALEAMDHAKYLGVDILAKT